MNSRMLVSLAVATMSLVLASGCSSSPAKKKSAEQKTQTKVDAPEVMGSLYTTVVFDKGKSNLSAINKESLQKLAETAHKNKKRIDEIRILSWADKEYPDKVKGINKEKDINLASERAERIKDYLENDLKETEDIDWYNMARRPNLLSKILRDDEFEVKEAFESSGTTGSRLPSGETSFTKASKALVIIDYEGEEDNLK